MITVDTIADVLRSHRFRASDERDLQDGVERVLKAIDVSFVREAPIAPGRIDFLCAGGIGIELKVAGSLADVTRQLHAYAQHPKISSLLLVTTRMQHRAVPAVFNGKSIRVVHLIGGAL